jgi:lipoprotein-releasing system permease protein
LNLAGYIARRVAFNPQKSFSRFIIRLAVAATTISVTAMIIALSFTNGFQHAISQKIYSFWGHIRVQHYEPDKVMNAEEYPIQKNDTVQEIIKTVPGIESIQAYATKNAILKTAESIEGILFKGIEKSYNTKRLQSFLKEGKWMNYPDSGYSNDIVLSAYTANQLKLKVNDPILIFFIQNDGSLRARKLNISGIYKTGIEDYDKLIAIGDIRLVQRLNDWSPDMIGGYEIFVTDFDKIAEINETIFNQLPIMWNSRAIPEIYPNIFDWLGLQDKTIAIVLIIMIIVAILNLITCLIILVLERTRMVGVLKALGAYNGTIQKIFLYHGAVITLAGILLGNILAFLIIYLQHKYAIISLPEEMYYIDKAEARVIPLHIIAVNLGTFIICMGVMLLPTLIIRRIQPVRAIQFK